MVTGKDFADFAAGQAGTWCYVWGGNGADMTAMDDRARNSWIAKQEGRLKTSSIPYAKRVEMIKTLYAKLDAQWINTIRGGDCSGFVFWCLKELGLQKSDLSSRGFFGICKRIEVSDLQPGDLVFKWTDKDGDGFEPSEIYHVGIYIGGGNTVECIGRAEGVVVRPYKRGGWGVCGRPKYFPDAVDGEDIDLTPKTPTVEVLGSVNVREAGNILGKRLGTAHRGDRLPIRDWSGEGWYRVDYKGRVGYISNNPRYTRVVEV